MSDAYAFWQAQLAGKEPETTPGTPHAGFYANDWRESYRNPNPTVGGPRRKIRIIPGVTAIWFENDEWLCRTDTPEGVRLAHGADDVDAIFARVCRKSISFETYTRKVHEYEQHRSELGAQGTPPVCDGRDGDEVRDGPAPIRADLEGDRVPSEWDA